MYVRIDGEVFEVDPNTGEVLEKFVEEKQTKYKEPKKKADDSALSSLDELKSYCSDTSREQRGSDGFLLDFQMKKHITLSDVFVWKAIASECLVHSYAVHRLDSMVESLPLDRKTILRSLRKLESLGLIRAVNDHFYHEDTRYTLYWLHPMACFKGSYWKHKLECGHCLGGGVLNDMD